MVTVIHDNFRTVLVFNTSQKLIAICKSLRAAAELINGSVQAVRFAAIGQTMTSGGFYFRTMNKKVVVDLNDLGRLKLSDYDNACGEERKYHKRRTKIRSINNQTNAQEYGYIMQ